MKPAKTIPEITIQPSESYMSSVSSATSETTSNATTANSTDAATADVKKQKDQFLQILLTQLKNQNPLDPQKPQDFATQLAQYSALEQQINTNTKLDSLISAANSNSVSPISYLGTTVDYESTTAPVQNEAATWNYSTTGAAAITIQIKDASGKVVYTGAGDTSVGQHTLTLNELKGVPDGTALTISVAATDAAGKAIAPTVTARALIDAVDSADGATTLEAGGYAIDSKLVKRIGSTKTAAAQSSPSATSTTAAAASGDGFFSGLGSYLDPLLETLGVS